MTKEFNPYYLRDAMVVAARFLAPLVTRLSIEEWDYVPFAATDGLSIGFNKQGMAKLPEPEQAFVFLHEIAHVMNGHPFIKRADFYKTLNMRVMDYAFENVANYIPKLFGFKVPPYVVYDSRWDGMTEWEIYHEIMKDPNLIQQVEQQMNKVQQNMEGKSQSGSSDGSVGEWRFAPHDQWGKHGEKEAQETKENMSRAVARASVEIQKAGRGDVAAYLNRLVDQLVDNNPWEFILEKYLEHGHHFDFSFRQPERKLDDGEFFFPSFMEVEGARDKIKKVFFMIDTSGSVTDTLLGKCISGGKRIVDDLGGYESYIGYCDMEVHSVGPLDKWDEVIPKGNGGTSFIPAFEWIEKHLDDDINVLVYCTDGEGSFPNWIPPYDVIWMNFGSTNHSRYPFGTVIDFKL